MKMVIKIISTLSLFAVCCSPVIGGELEDQTAALRNSFGALSAPSSEITAGMDIPVPVRAVSAASDRASQASICCANSADCTGARDRGFEALGVRPADLRSWEPSFAAFKILTANRWYTTFPDGNALTDGSVGSMWVTRKSFVGAYQFKIEKMSVLVTWNPDPILGFSKPGSSTMSIGKICFAQDRIEVFVSGHKLAIEADPRRALIQPSPNTGTDKPVSRNGYLMSTEYGQYLISSDGK